MRRAKMPEVLRAFGMMMLSGIDTLRNIAFDLEGVADQI
jgi:hypothetical protein